MNENQIQIVVVVDTAPIAAQITQQIMNYVNPSAENPHYVTKKEAITRYGWSEYHLNKGVDEGHLKPLRLQGRGEIRYSFEELIAYHNHLQENGSQQVQVNSPKRRNNQNRSSHSRNRR